MVKRGEGWGGRYYVKVMRGQKTLTQQFRPAEAHEKVTARTGLRGDPCSRMRQTTIKNYFRYPGLRRGMFKGIIQMTKNPFHNNKRKNKKNTGHGEAVAKWLSDGLKAQKEKQERIIKTHARLQDKRRRNRLERKLKRKMRRQQRDLYS